VSFAPGTTTRLPIQVGMGAATIIVPPQVCVQSDTRVGAGYVNVLGDEEGGLDVNRDLHGARSAAPRMQLQAKVGMGALEVVHRPEDSQFDDHQGRFHSGASTLENAACTGAVTG
jgi:hypothetical protein